MKQLRQRAIRDLVEQRPIRTQQELAVALRERGFRTTQATISRDVAELGLVKAGRSGMQAYAIPPRLREADTSGEDRIRTLLRDRTGRATTAGYGPRFLHSTGQLHKGGAPIGWFLQLTADHPDDRGIPGWPYTFGQLIDAQASGDLAAIESHDLPILRVHLGADVDAGLVALERALTAALATNQGG